MWLAVPIQEKQTEKKAEAIFDLMLALSPEVYFGPEGSALVYLGGVAHYWKLSTLQHSFAENNFEHPLLAKLLSLSRAHHLSFTLAPTACWAFWLSKFSPSSLINIWDRDRFFTRIENASIHLAQDFISDALLQSADARGAFDEFRRNLDDLGVSTLGNLLALHQDSALNMRFGPVCAKLLKRVRGNQDLELYEYVPSLTLEQSFYPILEDHLSSDKNPDVFARLHEILDSWEERLRARQSLLCGLHLSIKSSRTRSWVHLNFRLPKATRDPKILLKMLEEKWHSENNLKTTQASTDEVECIKLTSLGMQKEHDRQLSLFDPRREEVSQDWSLLIARLQSRSSSEHPVRMGTYQAFPSFWPETSMEWVDWQENLQTLVIEDHPARPHTLLRQPQALMPIPNESDYFAFLAAQNALNSLERVRDTWNGNFEERSYARVQNQWVYWDHHQKKVFLHGYFEH